MPTWTPPVTLVAGTPENVNDLNAILTSLQNVVNALDDANISATAGIQASKLATGATGLAQGAFSVQRAAALSLATGAVVVFDTKDFDTSSWYDTVTGRFTPQVAGIYRFSWSLRAGSILTADIHWASRLRKNGITNVGWGSFGFQRGAVSNVSSVGSASAIANGTTDYFEILTEHGVGAATSLQNGANTVFFNGELVGRT